MPIQIARGATGQADLVAEGENGKDPSTEEDVSYYEGYWSVYRK